MMLNVVKHISALANMLYVEGLLTWNVKKY
jgi:hypothetical protein